MARVTSPKETGLYIAISSGTFRDPKNKGRLLSYIRGKTYPADFPLVRVRPDAFEPLRFADETEPSAK